MNAGKQEEVNDGVNEAEWWSESRWESRWSEWTYERL